MYSIDTTRIVLNDWEGPGSWGSLTWTPDAATIKEIMGILSKNSSMGRYSAPDASEGCRVRVVMISLEYTKGRTELCNASYILVYSRSEHVHV